MTFTLFNRDRAWVWNTIFIVLTLLFASMAVMRPVSDPDFWWHLKSGEFIAKNHGLMQSDHFTFTGQGALDWRGESILKGYWLWQLAAYGLVACFGLFGVILVKGLTLAGIVAFIVATVRRIQPHPLVGIALTAITYWSLYSIYYLERPQIISFLGAGLLVGMFVSIRNGATPSRLLCPLMLLWANMHGGYVFGTLMLFAFAAGSVVEYRHSPKRRRDILLWAAAGVVITLLNPVTYKIYWSLFGLHGYATAGFGFVMEYANTLDYFIKFNKEVACYWLLLGLHLYTVVQYKERYLSWLFVAALLGILSFIYVRNVGFYTISMLPMMCFHFDQQLKSQLNFKAYFFKTVMAVMILTAFWYALIEDAWKVNRAGISDVFPKNAVEFIDKSGFSGNMFNEYDWGGYLIWKFYPKTKVFIDTRGMEERVLRDYIQIAKASHEVINGEKEYRYLLAKYNIDYVFQKLIQHAGILNPLMKNIMLPTNDEWTPVYLDQFSYIAIKNNGKNQAIIDKYRIDKKLFIIKAIGIMDKMINIYPKNPRYYVGKAELLCYYGSYKSAEETIAMAEALGADAEQVRRIRREIDILSGKLKQ